MAIEFEQDGFSHEPWPVDPDEMVMGETCPHCGYSVEEDSHPGHVTHRSGKVHEVSAEVTQSGPWGPAECVRVFAICCNIDTVPDDKGKGWSDWGECQRVTCQNCIRICASRKGEQRKALA